MSHTHSRRLLSPRFGAAALAVLSMPAHAGTYSTDFSTDPALTFFRAGGSNAGWVETGGNPDGYLRLTDNINSHRAVAVFPDFDPGTTVTSFTLEMDCRVGAGTTTPADGFSVNFASPTDPVLTNADTNGFAGGPQGGTNLPEEGTTTGISVGFDAHTGGAQDIIGISVRVDGILILQVPLTVLNGALNNHLSLQTGPQNAGLGGLGWAKARIELREDGTLDVDWKGVRVIDNLATGFTPMEGRFLIGGRTGGSNQHQHFDNIAITTNPDPLARVTKAAANTDGYRFEISDFETSSVLNPSTIELSIAGETVVPSSVTKDGAVTTITFNSSLTTNTTYSYSLSAFDQNNEPITRSGNVVTPLLPVTLLSDVPTLDTWNIREIRGVDVVGNPAINSAVQTARTHTVSADPVRVEDYTAPYFNLSDDNNSGSRGLFKRDAFYRTNNHNSATVIDDNNIVGLGKTRITVPETGTYTFWVQSDDGFALRVNGATFTRVVGAAGALIDPADPSTIAFQVGTGNSNTRGAVTLTEGVEYVIDFLWFEGTGGSFAEVAWAKGDFVDTPANGAFRLVGGAGQTPLFPANPLPVPAGTTNSWAVRDIRPTPGGTNLPQAIALAFTPGALTVTDKTSPVINFIDPEGAGGRGIFTNDMPYPNDIAGVAEDQFLTVATYQFDAAPGDYSFAITSDDGYAIRIIGGPEGGAHAINSGGPGVAPGTAVVPAITAAGNGIDPLDPRTVFNPVWSNDANFAVYRVLTAGIYTIEVISFENGGGASLEVAWAPGNHASRGSTGAWQLLGNTADPSIPPLLPVFAANIFDGVPLAPEGLWSVKFAYSDTAVTNIAQGIAAALNPAVTSHTGTFGYLNFRNFPNAEETETAWTSGLFHATHATVAYRTPVENQYLGATGLVNNVGVLARAKIVIPTAGNYTFGINSDDGFMFRILGAPNGFTRVSGSALIDPAQTNTVYRTTGSNNARAVINLPAGSYDVEFAYYEGTGNAHFELYAVAGNITNDTDTSNWRIVGHTESNGLGLAEQTAPAGQPNVGSYSFNAATGAFSITWSSSASATYAIQYSYDLESWMDLEATYAGAAGTTTYNGDANTLAPAGPKTKVFFRLKQN